MLEQAYITVLSGACAGRSATFQKSVISIGRHPDNDVRLDPRADLEVSSRHVVLEFGPPGWSARDLDSLNGTYVNGVRIHGSWPLHSGDQLRLGLNGPALEFSQGAPAQLEATHLDLRIAPGSLSRSPRDRRPEPAPVARRARAFAVAAAGISLLIAVAVGAMLLRQQRSFADQRMQMQSQLDSSAVASAQTIEALLGERDELADALRRSHDELAATHARLAQGMGRIDTSEIPLLRQRIRASAEPSARAPAAPVDFQSIQRRNRPAVALLYVEYEDGEMTAGTAFAVRPDATFLTNQHLISGRDRSRRPRRMAVQFADSDQVWPARLIGVSPESDLAVVKVDNIIGAVPTVRGFNMRADTLRAGASLVLLGYPHGGQDASERSGARTVRPLLSSGVLREVRPALVEIQGYGAVGASGSPIFDGNGDVVAILFGGRRGAGDAQTLLAVPVRQALDLLAGLNLPAQAR
jgi:pSer/pThr/pTyr-binding forkhead associated (FHA) protein